MYIKKSFYGKLSQFTQLFKIKIFNQNKRKEMGGLKFTICKKESEILSRIRDLSTLFGSYNGVKYVCMFVGLYVQCFFY